MSAPKRRASRLLAMAVPPKKNKKRELILTDRRLLCVKHKDGRQVQIRYQLWIQPPAKEKDQRHCIIAVECKGEREFVVLTVSVEFISSFEHTFDWHFSLQNLILLLPMALHWRRSGCNRSRTF